MAAPPPNPNTTVAKVVRYILFDWLRKHMEFKCHADTTELPPPMFVGQILYPAQYFYCTEVLRDRHFEIELRKEPYVYLMKELTVRWLPHLDTQPPPEFFTTVCTDKTVDHPSGFYRVISEVSEDYDYLVSLKITRI